MAVVLPWLEGRPRAFVRSLTPPLVRRAATTLLGDNSLSPRPAAPVVMPPYQEQTVISQPVPAPPAPALVPAAAPAPASADELNAIVDAALVELAKLNASGASTMLKAAEERSPNRPFPTHFYLFESYYAVDLGQPLDPLDVVTGRIQHARILINAALAGGGGGGGAGHVAFWDYYETYLERQRQFPKKLTSYGHRSFAVSNDDGILQEIFRRIGTTDDPYIVEFGINDGWQTNSTALVYQGWKALWLEASSCYYAMARHLFREFIARDDVRIACHFMTAEYVNATIKRHIHPGRSEIDLLSIDVDGNDYWLWKAIDCVNPRVVVIEYNSYYHPPVSIAQRYEPLKIFNGTTYYGSTLEAISRLADQKGYKLVACSFVGDNAYFVRDDLVGDHFYKPGDTTAHYEPNRGTGFPWCHAQGRGDYDMIS